MLVLGSEANLFQIVAPKVAAAEEEKNADLRTRKNVRQFVWVNLTVKSNCPPMYGTIGNANV